MNEPCETVRQETPEGPVGPLGADSGARQKRFPHGCRLAAETAKIVPVRRLCPPRRPRSKSLTSVPKKRCTTCSVGSAVSRFQQGGSRVMRSYGPSFRGELLDAND